MHAKSRAVGSMAMCYGTALGSGRAIEVRARSAKKKLCAGGNEAVVVGVHDAIALAARSGFELLAVHDRDVAALVLDEALAAEKGGDFADRLATHAEHLGEDGLRQRELGGARAILHEQQPSTRTLLDGVQRVARRGLMREAQRVLAIPLHDFLEFRAPPNGLEEHG